MGGMAEVGRLFNANELIVAEVLQSAEAMKAAVTHLEQFMEKSDTAKRGKVVLATVKGDVHDIGKNLVEIILKNNGFDVVNLGIKVPPEDLIKAYQAHRPDAIGLSGLLVKTRASTFPCWSAEPRSAPNSHNRKLPRAIAARCATPKTP
jgi:5-methyltetrahydrofolate--homocysteine methyltransferase